MKKLLLWQKALSDKNVWQRSLRLGLPVGLLQIVINQGDVLLHGAWTSRVVFKLFACPSISVAIALASASATYVASQKKSYEKTES